VLASPILLVAVSLLMALVALPARNQLQIAQSTGAVWTFSLLLGGAAALGLSMLLAAVCTGAFGMTLLRRKNAPPPETVCLTVRQGEVSRSVSALVDTGCRALDSWTGLPVVFVPEGLFAPEPGRILSIRTAAGARLVPCFVPDEVMIDGASVRAVVALLPGALLPSALAPGSLIPERKAS